MLNALCLPEVTQSVRLSQVAKGCQAEMLMPCASEHFRGAATGCESECPSFATSGLSGRPPPAPSCVWKAVPSEGANRITLRQAVDQSNRGGTMWRMQSKSRAKLFRLHRLKARGSQCPHRIRPRSPQVAQGASARRGAAQPGLSYSQVEPAPRGKKDLGHSGKYQ